MPTEAEFGELIGNCSWTWAKLGDNYGYYATSKRNGKYIFLPAAGLIHIKTLINVQEYGFYWSSTFSGDSKYLAERLSFFDAVRPLYTDSGKRITGCSIRPVTP